MGNYGECANIINVSGGKLALLYIVTDISHHIPPNSSNSSEATVVCFIETCFASSQNMFVDDCRHAAV